MSARSPRPEQDADASGAAGHRLSRHLPAILLAIICGVVFYDSATTLVEQGYASGTPITNAALYPRLLAGLLLALLALQVFTDIRAAPASDEDQSPAAPGHMRLSMFVAMAIVGYIMILPVLGFLVTTPVFVLVLLLVLGDRKTATLVAVPLGTTAGCVVVFQVLFNVNLPRGLFGLALNF